MRKELREFNREHLQFVIVDVVVCSPCPCPLVKVLIVQVVAKPLQTVLNGGVVVGQAVFNLLMKFNVVDAVAQDAAFRNDGPTQSALLVSVDDGLAGQTWAVGWMVLADSHGQLAFACPGRNVGPERGVSNEDLAGFAL